MQITVDFIEALLVRNWTLKYDLRMNKFVFRDPEGAIGEDYTVDHLNGNFPPAVETWINENIAVTAEEGATPDAQPEQQQPRRARRPF